MIRSSRTPTFILIALLVVILVLTYNYWSLSEKNQAMKSLLYKADEKKILIEKENQINSGRVKYYEDRADALQKSSKDKDDEIAKLQSKLEATGKENARLLWEVGDKQSKLEKCTEDSKTQITDLKGKHQEELEMLKINNTNLNDQIRNLLDTIAKDKVKLTLDDGQKRQICSNETSRALDEFKGKLVEVAKLQLDAQSAAKVQAFILKPVEVADRIIKADNLTTSAIAASIQTSTVPVTKAENAEPVLPNQIQAEAEAVKENDAQLDAPNQNEADRNPAKRDAKEPEPQVANQVNRPEADVVAKSPSILKLIEPSDDNQAAGGGLRRSP